MRRRTQHHVPYQDGEVSEVQRARQHGRKVRTLLDETFAQARDIQGKEPDEDRGRPGGGADRDDGWTAVLLRWWLIILGFALIVTGLTSAIVRLKSGAAISGPPVQGVVPSELVVETCEEAARQVSQPPAEPVTEQPGDLLNPDRAEDIADDVLARHLDASGDDIPVLASGPNLLQATLPDGTRQVVWARVWVPDAEPEGEDQGMETVEPTTDSNTAVPTVDPEALAEDIIGAGDAVTAPNALVLYSEPVSGQPLVLYEGVTIQRPLLAGCEETFISEAFESIGNFFAIRPETLGMLVVFVVGIITLAYWQRWTEAGPARDPIEAAQRAPVDVEE